MKGIVDYLLADENFKIVLSMIISIIVLIFNKVIVRAILAVIMKFFFKLSKEFKNKISSALENPFRLIIVTLSTFILLMAINAEHNFIKNIILIKLYSSINLLIILKLVYTLSDINSVLIERFDEKFNYSFDKGVMSLLSKTMKIIILKNIII